MKLIESKTLGTAAASIEFTSIPQDFTDLLIVGSARTNRSNGTEDNLMIAFNGSTANFTNRTLYADGSGATSTTFTPGGGMGFRAATDSTTSNTFGNSSLYLPNYTGATQKSLSIDSVTENNATQAWQFISANLWANTAAVTSISFTPLVGTLISAGSILSLYGILKGSDGIVTTS
jgi:hypothetical protein